MSTQMSCQSSSRSCVDLAILVHYVPAQSRVLSSCRAAFQMIRKRRRISAPTDIANARSVPNEATIAILTFMQAHGMMPS